MIEDDRSLLIKLVSGALETLNSAKIAEIKEVPIEPVITLLQSIIDGVNNVTNDAAFQVAQKKFENQLAIQTLQSPHQLEMFKSVIEAGLNALKSAILINGGAAAALLAFLGSLLNRQSESPFLLELTQQLSYALIVFLIGTGCAGTASGTRYLSQLFFAETLHLEVRQEGKKSTQSKVLGCIGSVFLIVSIVLGLSSFGGFFYGGWIAYNSFHVMK